MADEPKTPEEESQPDDNTTEGQTAPSAGPVAEEGNSSSQAAGESPSSTPPADEGEGSPVEAPKAEEPSEEARAEPEVRKARPEAEKKDVIPGADLEPIAVEPEARELDAEERARLEAEEEERARREAAMADAEDTEAAAASRAPARMESGARYIATGKRKSSIARVTLVPGSGRFEINQRSLEEFFPRPLHQTMARQPLAVSGYEGNVDVRVRVHGGGISGQAGAVRHGVARALTEIDAELRGDLKRRGFLTRDARVKERRKAGLKKARKRPQFSKR